MTIPAPELVEAAADAAGSRKRLAQRLDVDTSQIGRWIGGTSEPSYGYTMQMLEITGWLNAGGSGETKRLLTDAERQQAQQLLEAFEQFLSLLREAAGQ